MGDDERLAWLRERARGVGWVLAVGVGTCLAGLALSALMVWSLG